MAAIWFCYNNNNNNHHPPLKYNIQQSVLLSKYFSFSQFNTAIPLMYGQSDQRLPFLLSISEVIKYYYIVPLKRGHPSYKATF